MLYLAREVAWADYQNHPEYRAIKDQEEAECAAIDLEIKRLLTRKKAVCDAHYARLRNNETLRKFKTERIQPIEDAKEAEEARYAKREGDLSASMLDFNSWEWASRHGYIEHGTGVAHPVTDKGRAAVAKYEAENDR